MVQLVHLDACVRACMRMRARAPFYVYISSW